MNCTKNILLVEDDKDDQIFFTEAVREIENANLYAIANNGIEAIEKLKNAASLPDIIFMDINMPLMDGVECLTEITKHSHIKNIPVVMLTTDVGRMEIIRCLGVKAFIKKPTSSKELRQKIEQMINLDFILDFQIANKSFEMNLNF